MTKYLSIFSIITFLFSCQKNRTAPIYPAYTIAGTWGTWSYAVRESQNDSAVATLGGNLRFYSVTFDSSGNFTFTSPIFVSAPLNPRIYDTVYYVERGTFTLINDSQMKIGPDTSALLSATCFYHMPEDIIKFKKISTDSLQFFQEWVDSTSPLDPTVPIDPVTWIDTTGLKKIK